MDDSSIEKLLHEEFPETNKEDWKRAAISELNGNEPFKQLLSEDDDGVTFLPYYDNTDLPRENALQTFNFSPSGNLFLGSRAWLNLPAVFFSEELSGNKVALTHLNAGGDGTLFYVTSPIKNLAILLKDIQPEYCALSFTGDFSDQFVSQLTDYLHEHAHENVNGCLFWERFPAKKNIGGLLRYNNYRGLGLTVKPMTPVKEISSALTQGAKAIEALGDSAGVETVIRNIAFSLPLHNDFLSNVCKLKALRQLWFQVARSYDVLSFEPQHLHLHVRSEKSDDAKYNPHANLLKGTIAAMSAVAGGCDSLTILPQEESNALMQRMAVNVSNILREESHMNKVSDPLAGSFAIEHRVNEMAQLAWKEFQRSMQK